jgi:predicted dehydrogenase
MAALRLGIIGGGIMGSSHHAVFDSLKGTIEVTATGMGLPKYEAPLSRKASGATPLREAAPGRTSSS